MSDNYHYCYSKEYNQLCDKVFEVMVSCKTIEQWESCKKYHELAVDKALAKCLDNFDKMMVSSFGSFRRGFIAGVLSTLREHQRVEAVKDYLTIGC
jgi:hypothetical protein